MTQSLVVYQSASGDLMTLAPALIGVETEEDALARVMTLVPNNAVKTVIVSAISLPDPALRAAWKFDGDAVVLDAAKVSRLTTPETISDRQFFQQLAILGLISQEEALAAVKTGDIPQAMQVLVNQLPQEQQFAAQMLIAGATQFNRSHALTAVIRTLFGWTSEQTDNFWRAAFLL